MTAGRKPKPTHLKLVQGNPGKRPINRKEPIAAGDLKLPPAWMTESQKAAWKYAIAHAPAGLLRKIDRSLLAVWVVAEDLHREASLKVQQFGMLTKTAKNGEAVQSPYLPIVNRQALIMIKAASEMGFTPSSRSRLSASHGDEEEKHKKDPYFDD